MPAFAEFEPGAEFLSIEQFFHISPQFRHFQQIGKLLHPKGNTISVQSNASISCCTAVTGPNNGFNGSDSLICF